MIAAAAAGLCGCITVHVHAAVHTVEFPRQFSVILRHALPPLLVLPVVCAVDTRQNIAETVTVLFFFRVNFVFGIPQTRRPAPVCRTSKYSSVQLIVVSCDTWSSLFDGHACPTCRGIDPQPTLRPSSLRVLAVLFGVQYSMP